MLSEKIHIAGIPVNLFTNESLINTIDSVVKENSKKVFLHANAHLVQLANTNEKWLVNFFNNCDYVICDGSGIQLAARLTKQRIPTKIPFNTWIWDFIKFSSKRKIKLFLLGSDSATIESSKNNLQAKESKLQIVGYHHGYFNKDNSEENDEVIKIINNSKANVLIVGFGMPIQERWVKNNLEKLNINVILTCGGAFDFISGNKSVAPLFFRKFYLEWLFRFILEPRRLFKRATVSNFKFFKILLKDLIVGY